jgi:tetratricopeptide (TPR) repeat protein
MAFEKSKILKSAEKFVASGKISQAIDEYLKILKEHPKDWPLMIQIGDLLLKVNRNDEAIASFQKVADHYYADGFFLKAIAIYKRINKLNPNLTDICTRLADLYLKQGLTMDAKSQLHVVAQHYLSKNQNKDAIETLQRLIEIEPDNLKNRNELAKAYKNEGMVPEAIQEYLRITEELSRKNLFKECLPVLETAYKLDDGNTEVLQKLLTLYQEQGEPEKGFSLLEEALKTNPSDPDILALLAETYAAKNNHDKAHEVIDRAIANAGNKEPLWEVKGNLFMKRTDLDRAYNQFALIVEKEIQRKDIDRAVFLMQRITEADSTFDRAWLSLTELYTLLRQQANLISAYGSLVDAYISKAMYTEAAGALEKLIKLDPEDNQHQEKLRFVNSKLGITTQPAQKQEKVYEVEQEVARPAQQQQDYGNVSMTTESIPASFPVFQSKASPAQVQTVQQPVSAKSPAPSIPSISIVTAEEKEYVSEHLIEAEVFNKYGLIDKAIEQLNSIINKYPFSVPTRQKLKEILLEKGERDKAVEECIQMSRIFRKQGDLDQAEDLLSEARQINPNHAALERAFRELSSGGAAGTKSAPLISQQQPDVPSKPSDIHSQKPSAPASMKGAEKKTSKIDIPALDKLDRQPPASSKFRTRELPTTDANAAKARATLNELEKFAQQIKTQSGTFKIKQAKPVTAQPQPVPRPPTPAQEEALDIEIEIDEPGATPLAILPASEFEEIDFFLDQGLTEDAKNALKSLQQKYPADPGVFRRLDKIEQMESDAKQKEEAAVKHEPGAPLLDVSETGFPGPADSSEEVIISLDEDFSQEPGQKEPDIFAGIESVSDSMADVSSSPSPQIQEPVPTPGETTNFPEVEETDFTEFGELEDSQEAGLKPTAVDDDRSFEESFSDAVDAVFQVSDEASVGSADSSEIPRAIVKEELFEEEEDFFDLAAELEEGLLNVQSAVEEDRPSDGQNYSIEDILSDFKKGVDKQLGSEDYDTRYNLGIAYKEMGLIDEAIAEFQIAAKDPKRFLECCSMLGLCFVEKGMHKLAIKWYQRGLESPGYSEDEYQGVRFDLAQAYESVGETERALEVFHEVYGINANYRNVARKIKELHERKN